MGSEKETPLGESSENIEWASRLFEEHEGFIRSVIRYVINDPCEGDDFYQELFLYFALKPHPANIRKIRGFLYRVILDRAKDWHRRRSRHYQKLHALMQQVRQEWRGEDETASFFRSEEAGNMYHQIQQYLSANEAKAILYRYKHEYTLDETAHKMGLQPRTISRYVSVGLKKFRELLKNKERANNQ